MNKQKLLIISLSLLLVLVISLWYFYFAQNKSYTLLNSGNKSLEAAKNYLAFAGSSKCGESATADQKMLCYEELNKAINSTSTDSCNNLGAVEDIMVCRKATFIKAAVAAGDAANCDKLADATSKSLCIAQVSLKLATSKNDQKYCNNMVNADDKSLCFKILSGPSLIPFKSTTTIDFDLDGLSNDDEVKYGTDKGNSDTDSDGHSDAEEIKGGFNPCGSGKLPAPGTPIKDCVKFQSKK